jgi:hypothetical protein
MAALFVLGLMFVLPVVGDAFTSSHTEVSEVVNTISGVYCTLAGKGNCDKEGYAVFHKWVPVGGGGGQEKRCQENCFKEDNPPNANSGYKPGPCPKNGGGYVKCSQTSSWVLVSVGPRTWDPVKKDYYKEEKYEKYDSKDSTHVCDRKSVKVWENHEPTTTIQGNGDTDPPPDTKPKRVWCADKPSLDEVLTDGKWDIFKLVWDDNQFAPAGKITAQMEGSFRNPAVNYGCTKWATEVETDGETRIHVYNFDSFSPFSVIAEPGVKLMEPELVLHPDQTVIFVQDSDDQLIAISRYGWGQREILPAQGRHPHSLVVGDSYRLAFSTPYLGVIDESGEVHHYNIHCARPEWLPDGSGIVCRDGQGLFLIRFPDGKIVRMNTYSKDLASLALDPNGSGLGLYSLSDKTYFSRYAPLGSLIPLDEPFGLGWGSDIGGSPLTVLNVEAYHEYAEDHSK